MLKTDDVCQISEMPGDINVSSMAGQSRKNGRINNYSSIHNKARFVLKTPESLLGSEKRSELLVLDDKNQCKDVPAVRTKDIEINATLFEKYNKGEVIIVDNMTSTRKCPTVYFC